MRHDLVLLKTAPSHRRQYRSTAPDFIYRASTNCREHHTSVWQRSPVLDTVKGISLSSCLSSDHEDGSVGDRNGSAAAHREEVGTHGNRLASSIMTAPGLLVGEPRRVGGDVHQDEAARWESAAGWPRGGRLPERAGKPASAVRARPGRGPREDGAKADTIIVHNDVRRCYGIKSF